MTTPPTEDEARSLLARAAATIEVDETAPMTLAGPPEPRPRRWPMLAAAAGVVLAIGGGFLVAQQLGDDPQPVPVIEESEADDPTPDGREHVLDGDQLPSLIGYTEDEAIALLQQRGYPVEVRVVPDGCDVAGIVINTRPPVGARMEPGDPATLRVVGEQDVIDCVGEVPWSIVWDVVRSARGLEQPPSVRDADFPEDVQAAVEGVLDAPVDGGTQELVAVWAFDRHPCWDGRVDGIRFFVQSGRDDLVCPATSVVVEYEGDTINGVRVEGVGEEEITEEELAAGMNRLSAATRFVAWARGEGPAPEFADRVRHLAGGSPRWNSEPELRIGWSGCSGLGFPDCGIDPVGVVHRTNGNLRPAAGSSGCVRPAPGRFADADTDVIRLERVSGGCALVELWIDEDGSIYAVRQVGG